MTEIKVHCACGQKFKFDVEPVGGKVPFAVNCPACGADGTAAANAILAQQLLSTTAPRPVTATAAAPPLPRAPRPIPAPRVVPAKATAPTDISLATEEALRAVHSRSWEAKDTTEFHLSRGVLGAVLGAGLGFVLLVGFVRLFHFVFPYSFAGMGALTGLGARIGYRGTSSTLGLIAALIFVGSLVLLCFLLVSPDKIASAFISLIFSLAFGAWAAYKIAS
jgi:hypothetical protein